MKGMGTGPSAHPSGNPAVMLSIVIVSYNCRDYLEKCLASIRRHLEERIQYEIILIDNASVDLSCDEPILSDSHVRFFRQERNIGFPAGNNAGFAIAAGRYILMLNPDTELLDDGILEMIGILSRSQDIGIIAPRTLNSDLTVQRTVQHFPDFISAVASMFNVQRQFHPALRSDRARMVPTVMGSFMLFDASLAKRLDGLDESLFWIEDLDLCYRASESGLGTMYYPGSQIIHHGGKSSSRNPNTSLYMQLTNRPRYFLARGKRFQGIILYFIVLFAILFRYLLYGTKALCSGDTRRVKLMNRITPLIISDLVTALRKGRSA